MTFSKKIWATGDLITADLLNSLEQTLSDHDINISDVLTNIGDLSTLTTNNKKIADAINELKNMLGNGGVLVFNTLTDLQTAFPNGTDRPAWIKSDNNWFYWTGNSSADVTAPNNVTNLAVSNITQTSLTLSWTSSSSLDVVGYDIYQGSTLLGTVTGISYNVVGLIAATQYNFTIKAKDNSGNISSGSPINATTLINLPNDVTNLSASNITTSGLTLSWTTGTGADSYDIYQGSVLIGNVADLTYNVTGLTSSTQYTFKVISKNTVGSSNGVSVIATTAQVIDTTPPNDVTNLTVGSTTNTSITVSWSLSSSMDTAKYEVDYSSDGGQVYTVSSNLINSNSTSYTVNGLSNSTNYVIKVIAIDGASNRSNGVTVSASTTAPADTTPPNDVTNLVASNVGMTSLTLTWDASNSSDIASYDIYQGSTLLGNTNSLNYNVTNLFGGTAYTFTVKSKDNSGNISAGVSVAVTTLTSVAVTGVSLDKTSASIDNGTTLQLTATVLPSNATNKNVSWSSSNTSIATVDNNGLVSGVSVGTVTISVTTQDGGHIASCNLTVNQVIIGFDYNNLVAYPDSSTVTLDQTVTTSGGGGAGDWVHPSILYFENGWNGHKYWGGFSPYPDTNGAYENTYFFYSDDGDSWHTPSGVTGTIFPLQTGFGNNSDPNLFMDFDGTTMHILNRAVYNPTPSGMSTSTASVIEIISTTNGTTFTQRQTIIDTVNLGYDIVAPSVVKANGKYYMFAQRTDNLNVMCVFEATTANGTWTKINEISTGSLGALWHCEVRYLNQEFIVIGSSGGINGGNLMLGKFSNPMDTTIVGRNNFLIIAPNIGGAPWTYAIYKSSLVVKSDVPGNVDIEVFIGFKGSALNSNTDWRVSRCPVQRLAQTLDLSGYQEYTAGALATTSVATNISDYHKFVFDFTLDSLTTKAVSFARTDGQSTQHASIYITNNILYCELWGPATGSAISNKISYGISVNDRITMVLDTDLEWYINGRLVSKISNAVSLFSNWVGRAFGAISGGSISNVKIYKKPEYFYNATSAINYKDIAKTDTNNLIIVDEFNRTALGVSDNSFDYAVDGKWIGNPYISSNAVVVGSSDTNALIIPTDGNFQVLLGGTGANPLWKLYLKYTDANNFAQFCPMDGGVSQRQIRIKTAGTNSDTTVRSYVDDYKNHLHWRLDYIDGYLYVYTDNVFGGKFQIPATSFNAFIGVTGVYQSTAIDYLVVRQLDSTVPVVRVPLSRNFTDTFTVSLGASGTGTNIYYTTDGSTPTTSSSLYSTPFIASATTIVKAIAVSADGTQTSPVKTSTYTLVTPSISLMDDFNRADTTASLTGLGNTSVGNATWTATPATSTTAMAQILNNQAKFTANGNWYVESGKSDWLDIEFININSLTSGTSLIIRYIDDNNYFTIKRSNTTIEIDKKVNNVFSIVSTVSIPAGTNENIKVSLRGVKIFIYYNGTQELLVETPDLMAGTKHGIIAVNNTIVDDFKITSYQ